MQSVVPAVLWPVEALLLEAEIRYILEIPGSMFKQPYSQHLQGKKDFELSRLFGHRRVDCDLSFRAPMC